MCQVLRLSSPVTGEKPKLAIKTADSPAPSPPPKLTSKAASETIQTTVLPTAPLTKSKRTQDVDAGWGLGGELRQDFGMMLLDGIVRAVRLTSQDGKGMVWVLYSCSELC
jgi:hypothetical protein